MGRREQLFKCVQYAPDPPSGNFPYSGSERSWSREPSTARASSLAMRSSPAGAQGGDQDFGVCFGGSEFRQGVSSADKVFAVQTRGPDLDAQSPCEGAGHVCTGEAEIGGSLGSLTLQPHLMDEFLAK